MAKPFLEPRNILRNELRERLLRAGVAPRHVGRYLAELADHLADLSREEESAGRSRADAETAALARLGTMDDLANAMTSQRNLQSWTARAPWAIFALAPFLSLAAAWTIALLILWTGWEMFLPGAATPFGAAQAGSIFRVREYLFSNRPHDLLRRAIPHRMEHLSSGRPSTPARHLAHCGSGPRRHRRRHGPCKRQPPHSPRTRRIRQHGLHSWLFNTSHLRQPDSRACDSLAHRTALPHLALETRIVERVGVSKEPAAKQ